MEATIAASQLVAVEAIIRTIFMALSLVFIQPLFMRRVLSDLYLVSKKDEESCEKIDEEKLSEFNRKKEKSFVT